MTAYPVTRLCPAAAQPAVRVLGYARGADIVGADPAYRPNALEILGIGPDDAFPIVQGPTGFVYAGWLPDEEFLRREYEEASDYSGSPTEAVGYRQFMLEFAAGLLDEAVARLTKRPLRLLDYGSGHGQLLRFFASREVQAFGYEPTAARAAWSSAPNVLSDLDDVRAAGPFDLFVCTEVLEHLADPRAALAFMRENAAPGALLAVTVPGCTPREVEHALAATAAGREPFPAVLNPFEHLNQFNAASLRAMLAEEGFRVVRDFGRARPMTLAAARFGAGPLADLKNLARIAWRARRARPTTQVFCALA